MAHPKLHSVTLVEPDRLVTELARTELKVRMYNLDSLRNPKLRLIHEEPSEWLKHATGKYGVILIDFPVPRQLSAARLYTAEFLQKVFRLLEPKGFVSINAGPAFQNGADGLVLAKPVASLQRTLATMGKRGLPYINPRDDKAFILASGDSSADLSRFFRQMGIIPRKGLSHFCLYKENWKSPSVSPNSLTDLELAAYTQDWMDERERKTSHRQNDYRNNHSIFLPD